MRVALALAVVALSFVPRMAFGQGVTCLACSRSPQRTPAYSAGDVAIVRRDLARWQAAEAQASAARQEAARQAAAQQEAAASAHRQRAMGFYGASGGPPGPSPSLTAVKEPTQVGRDTSSATTGLSGATWSYAPAQQTPTQARPMPRPPGGGAVSRLELAEVEGGSRVTVVLPDGAEVQQNRSAGKLEYVIYKSRLGARPDDKALDAQISKKSPVASLRLVPAGRDAVLIITLRADLRADADPRWRVVKVGDETHLEVDFADQPPAAEGGRSTPPAPTTPK